MTPALRWDSLRFTYAPPPPALALFMGAGRSSVEVLKGLTAEIAPGERVCLMGPNGAGKTTLLKLVLGLLSPSSGEISIFGEAPGSEEIRRRIGFAHGDERSFYWRLSVRENLLFFGRLWGMEKGRAEERVAALARELEIGPLLTVPFARLSSGQRQKAVLARALLHDPQIVLMDEPTRSLDIHAAARFRELLTGPSLDGRALLVATHNPAEARQLAPRCLILAGGRLAHDGEPLPEADLDALLGGAA